MIKHAVIILLCLIPVRSFAQQQQQSTSTDRIALYYAQCVSTFEKRNDEFAVLQKQLADAQARIKELETKPDETK